MRKKTCIIIPILFLLAATLACRFYPGLPRMEVGEVQEENAILPVIDATQPSSVHIRMGAGPLNLTPGAIGLLDVSIRYNVEKWKPVFEQQQNGYFIRQEDAFNFTGVPTETVRNTWDVKCNSEIPFDLKVEAGAYKGRYDFSGLRLQNLEITEGGSDSQIIFNALNPESMDKLVFRTGASNVEFYGLANANFSEMSFLGGAGNYTFDFSGELQKSVVVSIKSAVSAIKIVIPEGMTAQIENHGNLKNIQSEGVWSVVDDTWTSSGSGPVLLIDLYLSLGSVTLIQGDTID